MPPASACSAESKPDMCARYDSRPTTTKPISPPQPLAVEMCRRARGWAASLTRGSSLIALIAEPRLARGLLALIGEAHEAVALALVHLAELHAVEALGRHAHDAAAALDAGGQQVQAQVEGQLVADLPAAQAAHEQAAAGEVEGEAALGRAAVGADDHGGDAVGPHVRTALQQLDAAPVLEAQRLAVLGRLEVHGAEHPPHA